MTLQRREKDVNNTCWIKVIILRLHEESHGTYEPHELVAVSELVAHACESNQLVNDIDSADK